MVSTTAPGVNRRVVVNALDDVIVETVPGGRAGGR